MDAEQARAIAERLHRDDNEEDGTPLLAHVRRVVAAVGAEARVVAWLHEALEWTTVSEHELLLAGLSGEELRALRLLTRTTESRFDAHYLTHLELIARADGTAGRLARAVKVADLADRARHPHARHDGWAPPYEAGMRLLLEAEVGLTRAPFVPRQPTARGPASGPSGTS